MAMFNSKLLVPGPSASEAGAARAVWTASIEHTLARPGGSVAALGPWAPGPKPGVETMGLIWLNQENWGVKQHIYIYIYIWYIVGISWEYMWISWKSSFYSMLPSFCNILQHLFSRRKTQLHAAGWPGPSAWRCGWRLPSSTPVTEVGEAPTPFTVETKRLELDSGVIGKKGALSATYITVY